MGDTMELQTLTTARKPPSPHEESDSSSDDTDRPLVLKQVLADLKAFTDELGSSHIKVAETWNSLGLIRLYMQQNVHAAIKCHQEALSIYTGNQNSSSVDIAVTLNDLGRCYERLNDQKKALETYERAHEMVLKDSSIRKTHSVVEAVKRSMARLQRS